MKDRLLSSLNAFINPKIPSFLYCSLIKRYLSDKIIRMLPRKISNIPPMFIGSNMLTERAVPIYRPKKTNMRNMIIEPSKYAAADKRGFLVGITVASNVAKIVGPTAAPIA